MVASLQWADDDDELPAPVKRRQTLGPGELPPAVEAALWRGNELGSAVDATLPSGFAAIDAQLPGNGWPCHALTEVLQPQPGVAEWRLLAPAMQQVTQLGRDIVVVGPPRYPHLPGLVKVGLDERRLIWVKAEAPAERLWTTEQLIKSNAAGLVVAWLPQARQEQIRRLQVCATSCDGPVFLCRPAAAEHQASAAPLRLELRIGVDWNLSLRIVKRKGSVHEGVITVQSIPGGLEPVLTPRMLSPSKLRERRDPVVSQVTHAVGSTAHRQPAGAH